MLRERSLCAAARPSVVLSNLSPVGKGGERRGGECFFLLPTESDRGDNRFTIVFSLSSLGPASVRLLFMMLFHAPCSANVCLLHSIHHITPPLPCRILFSRKVRHPKVSQGKGYSCTRHGGDALAAAYGDFPDKDALRLWRHKSIFRFVYFSRLLRDAVSAPLARVASHSSSSSSSSSSSGVARF